LNTTPTGIAQQKERIRENMRFLLQNTGPGVFYNEGVNAAQALARFPFGKHSVLLTFLSLPSEINTEPVIQAALDRGMPVYAPRAVGNSLAFYRILSTEGPFETNRIGVREPPAKPERLFNPAGAKPLVLVPGLAFDRAGHRLGRGGGCYDRFLASLRKQCRGSTALGMCLHRQIVEEVPTEPHDVKVDGLLI
jgi:5-formyltetrahydrofolate cyclo-ligase